MHCRSMLNFPCPVDQDVALFDTKRVLWWIEFVCLVLPEVDVDYSISRKGIRESFRQPSLSLDKEQAERRVDCGVQLSWCFSVKTCSFSWCFSVKKCWYCCRRKQVSYETCSKKIIDRQVYAILRMSCISIMSRVFFFGSYIWLAALQCTLKLL